MIKHGPVDVIVMAFGESRFDGSVLAELEKKSADGTIRVLDAMVLFKDADEVCWQMELSGLSPEQFTVLDFIEAETRGLFPDYRAVERDFYARTGIFPIMHAVAIKKELLQQNPWFAEVVFNAYTQAKQITYAEMAKIGWAKDMLPWYGQELEETRALMGDDFYSYGIEANRKALEALFRYSYQQGLCSRKLTVEELFSCEF